jgi:hypothetical protein
MHDRITRIETVAENQEKLISDTRADLRGIRSDMKSMENRIVDKMDEIRSGWLAFWYRQYWCLCSSRWLLSSAAAGFVVSIYLCYDCRIIY